MSSGAVSLYDPILIIDHRRLGWAIAILHVRRHNWTAHPLELAPWQMLLAAIPLPVAALAVEEPLTVAWSPRLIGLLSSACCRASA